MSSEPRSGIAEYFAAIQARTLRRAIATVQPNTAEILTSAQDTMWRQAAAKIRAEDDSAIASQSAPLPPQAETRAGGNSDAQENGAKGGRPRQWFNARDPERASKQEKAEEIMQRGFDSDKSDHEINAKLVAAFPKNWGHQRMYLQRIDRFRNRAKTRRNS